MTRQDQMQSLQHVTPEQRQAAHQALAGLLTRSTTDRAFRQQLLTNPRAAIATYAGIKESDVPKSLDIVFIENDASATIVLPDPINADELADADLETVAGGTDVIWGEIVLAGIFIIDTLENCYKLGAAQ